MDTSIGQKQVLRRGRAVKDAENRMDASGRVQVIVRLVVPGRPNTLVSGNIHKSFSLDDVRVSEVYDAIAKTLNLRQP